MHEHTTHMIRDKVTDVMRTSSTHSFSTSTIIVAASSTMSMAAFSSTEVPQSPDLDPVPRLNARLAAPLNPAHQISSRSGKLMLVQNASHLTLIESRNAAYAEMQKQLHIMTGKHQAAMSTMALLISILSEALAQRLNAWRFAHAASADLSANQLSALLARILKNTSTIKWIATYHVALLTIPHFKAEPENPRLPSFKLEPPHSPRSVSIKNETFEYDNIEIKQESPSPPVQDVLMPSTHRVHFEDEGVQKRQREDSPGDERPKTKRRVSDTPRVTRTYSSSSKSRRKKSTR
ncbi:hypothetical protein NP233_g10459 [Leucocoprinus birnbaumii]|uniref:Uncharacterized protein n=1 Tax=Leucocoprinus birnbaumii TaxID=56174 RepID=A0AAD5VKA9_9AGAR|nr:hypothetical protein NP233_g10459 [Leucocoprinus birnbaumii]